MFSADFAPGSSLLLELPELLWNKTMCSLMVSMAATVIELTILMITAGFYFILSILYFLLALAFYHNTILNQNFDNCFIFHFYSIKLGFQIGFCFGLMIVIIRFCVDRKLFTTISLYYFNFIAYISVYICFKLIYKLNYSYP